MQIETLISRIRAGDAQNGIADFIAEIPGATLENLVVTAMQWPEAEDVKEILLLEYLKEFPDSVPVRWALAQMMYTQKRFVDAMPHYRSVLESTTQVGFCYHAIAVGLSTTGSVHELRDLILEAKREIPDDEHPNWQFPMRLNDLRPPHRTHHQLWFREHLTKCRTDRLTQAAAAHIVTWHPLDNVSEPTEGMFRLAGAAKGINTQRGYFLIDDTLEVAAEPAVDAAEDTQIWTAEFTATPGAVHRVTLCLETADGISTGNQIELTSPPPPFAEAKTGDAYEVGMTGATFTGHVAASGSDARYRFEYGASPDTMSHSTSWCPVPGPLNGRVQAAPYKTPLRFYFYGSQITWEPGESPGLVCHWPFGQDPNHISGIGFLELLFAAQHNSCQYDGFQTVQDWEGSDIRDARVTLRLTAKDFDSNDTQQCFGIGSRRACWMLTGQTFNLANIEQDGEVEISATLSGDRGQWTFAGNNPVEQPNYDRYGYEPLKDTLADHIGNIFMVAPFGDIRGTITGTLSVKDAIVEYRSKNILHVDAGAQLVTYPTSSTADPKSLADGIRSNEDAGWYQTTATDTPPTFIWTLPKPVKITTVVLHQDIAMPTKRARLTVTGPDGVFVKDEALPTDFGQLSVVPQLNIPMDLSGPIDEIKLELLDGVTPDGMGLHAIEVFAEDYSPPPCTIPTTVLEDVEGLPSGEQVFYRLVCTADEEESAGDIHDIMLPADSTPRLIDASVFSIETGKAVIRIRINPMGYKTTARWHLDDGTSGEIPCGWENVAAHRFISVHDAAPGSRSLTVKLINDQENESQELSVSWSQAD